MQFETANGVLIARNGGEMLRIEPWGKNSLRVRATMLPELSNQDLGTYRNTRKLTC